MPTKLAVTDFSDRMVTVHVVPETASHPLQLVKRRAGLAVSVTTVSMVYDFEHSVPQLTPEGSDVTLPWSRPRPALVTVRVNRFRSNVAVTVVAAVMVTVQVVPATESHPLQPANVDRLSGTGVRVIVVPTS